MRWIISLLLIGLIGLAEAASSSGNRLLVVLEESGEKAKYSEFLGDLEGRGYDITFESPKSDKLSLFEHGAKVYDHLLILPSKSKGLGPNLTPAKLLEFINAEGNVLLTLSSSHPTPTALVSLLLELDIHLPTDRDSLVVDHFNYDTLTSADPHDVVLVPRPDPVRQDVRNFFRGFGNRGEMIAFPRGVGQILGNASPLLTPILRAPRTAYSYNPKDEPTSAEDPFAVGQQLALVSAMQARNSARFTVVGSAEMLQNQWFGAKVVRSIGEGGVGKGLKEFAPVNREFAKEVSGWTFKEIGVLKVGNVEHSLNEADGGSPSEINPKIYRVKNTVNYSIEISEYLWNQWIPFNPEASDQVQLEFSMLSPFHRLRLVAPPLNVSSPETTRKFSTTFKLPDQHGIFNFKVNYKRPFYTNIEEKNTVTVRHFAHDEWPRSWVISGAWPWMMGIAVTVIGWVAFIALWLWSAPANEKKGLKVGGAKKLQ